MDSHPRVPRHRPYRRPGRLLPNQGFGRALRERTFLLERKFLAAKVDYQLGQKQPEAEESIREYVSSLADEGNSYEARRVGRWEGKIHVPVPHVEPAFWLPGAVPWFVAMTEV